MSEADVTQIVWVPRRDDVFPPTMRTWIGRALGQGEQGAAEVRSRLMGTYAQPLKVYYFGSSFRWLGEGDDIVQGFFASRLGRPAFLSEWQMSGRRLRHWVVIAFKHYLLEETRRRRRQAREQALPDDPALIGGATEKDAERNYNRSVAATTVREAKAAAQALCEKAGQAQHWRIFIAHVERDRTFAAIAVDEGISEVKAKVMSRTASNKFRTALLEALGCDAEDAGGVDAEFAELMEALRA